MKVNVKKLDPKAQLPVYGTEGAACFDIHALEADTIFPNCIGKIETGLAFEVPENHVMLLYGRSGHANKGLSLANCVGVIDSDYRGELIVMLRNNTSMMFRVAKGERCAQAMIIPTFSCEFNQVDTLLKTKRDTGGFGSTGK